MGRKPKEQDIDDLSMDELQAMELDKPIEDNHVQPLPTNSYDDMGGYNPPVSGSGEPIIDKPTGDKFFDTEEILDHLEKNLRGFQKRNREWVYVTKPIARDEFINATINSLRSVINPVFLGSKMTEDQIEHDLLEKNTEYIFMIGEEPTVDEKDVEYLVNLFDLSLELFFGIVKNGHGSESMRQMSASIYENLSRRPEPQDDAMLRMSWGDKDLLRLGGRK